MQQVLKEKLAAYIQQNNPELMIELQQSLSVFSYLEQRVSEVMPLVMQLLEQSKPSYVIEELALAELTKILRPSWFNYIKEILGDEFPVEFKNFQESGILTYETINLIGFCKETYESFMVTEDNIEDRFLRYAMIAKIHEYLN